MNDPLQKRPIPALFAALAFVIFCLAASEALRLDAPSESAEVAQAEREKDR